MNEKKNCGEASDNQRIINRTKWEKDSKGEKRSFLVRSAEEREARRALRDFKRDFQWEHLDDRDSATDD